MSEIKDVPYMVHEDAMIRNERHIRRLWILCILLVVLLVGTNGAWLWYESQFFEQEVTQEVDTGAGDATVIGIGDYNGESKADN